MTIFNHDGLEQLWEHADGPADEADLAAAIAQAESGGDSTKILNTAYPSRPHYQHPPAGALPEYSVGLWQVNLIAWPQFGEAELLDPAGNARAAVTISRTRRGFLNWTTFKHGTYEKYLTSSTTTSGSAPAGDDSADTKAPQTLRGWHEINLTLSRRLPASVFTSERLGYRTAANLARRRK